MQRLLTGTRRRAIDASFTTIGGSLAWLAVRAPLPFEVLFTGRPGRGGGCETRTFVFLPPASVPKIPRIAALLHALLRDDHRILDGMRFSPRFTETDAPVRAFAESVNAAGAW